MPMKCVGDMILGYRLVSEPQLSGQSQWAFAEKDGKNYFIKQFLSPVQPSKGEPGSAATFAKKKLAADLFEKRQSKLNEISSAALPSENLAVPIEARWVNGKYTKISVKIRAIDVRVDDLVKQSVDKRAMIMLQLSEALRTLHQLSIVHSDIKWTNILFERTESSVNPKLIDFDAGYCLSDKPLDPDGLTFDAPYAAPEIWKFTRSGADRDRAMIGLHSDIFSLGVLFHEIACGKKPLGNKSIPYGEYLLSYTPSLQLSSKSRFFGIVSAMLQFEVDRRPSIQIVIDRLAELLGIDLAPETIASIERSDDLDEISENPDTTSADDSSLKHYKHTVYPVTTAGIKGVLVRTLGWMWGRSTSPIASDHDVAVIDIAFPKTTETLASSKALSVSNIEGGSSVKVSSSFASKEVERVAGKRIKMTFSNRPDREVPSIVKLSARVKLPEATKVKTTIKR